MPEKSISDRLDDYEIILESQKTNLLEHSARLRALETNITQFRDLEKRIGALEADLKLLIRHSDDTLGNIKFWAEEGHPGLDADEVKQCKEFREKYGITGG